MRDQSVRRNRPERQQLDRALEVAPLMDPGADHPQLTHEDPVQVEGPGAWVDAHDDDRAADPDQVGGHERSGGRPGDLEHHIRPRAAGPVRHPWRKIYGRGIQDGEAESFDLRPASRIDLDDHHVGALVPGDRGDEHPDRAATEHDRAVAGGELGPANVVDRHRGRFDQGRVVETQIGGKRDQLVGVDVPEALQRARKVDPAHQQGMTDVLVASSAGRTDAVPGQGHDRDVVPHGPPGDPVPQGRDHTAHLVPEDGRRPHAFVHLPLQHVQVRAADPGVRHLDLHLTGSQWLGFGRPDRDLAITQVVLAGHAIYCAYAAKGARCFTKCSAITW